MSYIKPDTGVGLGKPCGNTVTSPLCLKFVVVETPAIPPTTGHITTYIKPICSLNLGPSIQALQLRNHHRITQIKLAKLGQKPSSESSYKIINIPRCGVIKNILYIIIYNFHKPSCISLYKNHPQTLNQYTYLS